MERIEKIKELLLNYLAQANIKYKRVEPITLDSDALLLTAQLLVYVEKTFSLETEVLLSKSKKRKLSYIRTLLTTCLLKIGYRASKNHVFSLIKMGAVLGVRDHSTVIHAMVIYEDFIKGLYTEEDQKLNEFLLTLLNDKFIIIERPRKNATEKRYIEKSDFFGKLKNELELKFHLSSIYAGEVVKRAKKEWGLTTKTQPAQIPAIMQGSAKDCGLHINTQKRINNYFLLTRQAS